MDGTLLKGLELKADFEIINSSGFELLNNFKGIRLLRRARMIDGKKIIQIYPKFVKVLDIKSTDLHQIDARSLKINQF